MIDESLLHMFPDADIENVKRKFLDISYGTQSEFEKLDLYLPSEGEDPFPVIIFIHGGAWYACDKGDTQIEPYLTLLSEGYALASVNYRLSDEAVFPAGVFDCKAAVRFLKAHAAEYQLDPERMALAGQSAGAYYALMLGSTIGKSDMEDLSIGWEDQNSIFSF